MQEKSRHPTDFRGPAETFTDAAAQGKGCAWVGGEEAWSSLCLSDPPRVQAQAAMLPRAARGTGGSAVGVRKPGSQRRSSLFPLPPTSPRPARPDAPPPVPARPFALATCISGRSHSHTPWRCSTVISSEEKKLKTHEHKIRM